MNDIRTHFPLLKQEINGYPLVYLDSAATAQKPQCVIDAIAKFYATDYGNIKRGVHPLSERATEKYEAARKRVQQFVHAERAHEIIFTRSTTESINLVARSWGEAHLRKGDVVLLSLLEHHSNIVPWLQLKEKIGIDVQWIELTEGGTLDMEDATQKLASGNVKMVGLTCVSNVIGVRTPFEEITTLAHEHGALILLDAAQLAPHDMIDVQSIGCDFLTFSGHKTYGPSGIGALYGKSALLDAMPPFLGGGSMIQHVTRDGFSPAHLPDKFEAGTPAITPAVGLHAALDFVSDIGWDTIQQHEQDLLLHARDALSTLDFIEVLGPQDQPLHSCLSFVMKTEGTSHPVHPHDITEYLGQKGIHLRAGNHCAQPLHDAFGHTSTTRLAVGMYNTKEEIDVCVKYLKEAWRFFTQ